MDREPAAAQESPAALEAVDREREILAAELHDGLGQTLVSVNLLAAMGARLAEGRTAADDPLREQLARLMALSREATERVRGLSRTSSPAPGERLEQTLETLAGDLRMRFQVRTSWAVPADPLPAVTPAWMRQLYLALADTARHVVRSAPVLAMDLYAEHADGSLELVLSAACEQELQDAAAGDDRALQLAAWRTRLLGGTLRTDVLGRRLRAVLRIPC